MLALECVRTRLRLGIAEERCKVTVPLLLERAARSVFILNTYLFLMETYLDFRESELRGIAYSDISGKGVNAYVVGAARRLSGLRTL